jgi:hypothetical protein
MKRIQLILISLAALMGARPQGFATANAATEKTAEKLPADPTLQAQLATQAAQIGELQKQLAAAAGAASVTSDGSPEDSSTLVLLCKGAGADLADVRWRVRAGLDPEQAVQATLAQAASDQRKAAEGKLATASSK